MMKNKSWAGLSLAKMLEKLILNRGESPEYLFFVTKSVTLPQQPQWAKDLSLVIHMVRFAITIRIAMFVGVKRLMRER